MWNPTTNEIHHIPHTRSRKKDFLYGFGAVDGDFKVVRLTSYHSHGQWTLCHFGLVYSLNTESWTLTEPHYPRVDVIRQHPSRYNAAHGRYNVLVNGVYYWITSSNLDIPRKSDILCFNFCNNKFWQLESPISYAPLITSYCEDLIEIKGSLGYVLQTNLLSDNVCFHIWLMDQNSWTIKYRITMPMLSLHRFGDDAAEIFGGKAGELLKTYDHHGIELRQFQIKIPENDDYFRIYEYVPSITLLSK